MSETPGEQGTVMVVVMTILIALLAGGAVALYVQVSDTRSTGMVKNQRSGMFCAEAGIATAVPILVSGFQEWNTILSGGAPSFTYPIVGEIDEPLDGTNDFSVTISDNVDDFPGPQNLAADNDLKIFVHSKCTKFPEAPVTVTSLIELKLGEDGYDQDQQDAQGSGVAR